MLGGSYARGTADAYSDVDLYLITRDDAYEDFLVGRADFVQQLGEPVFLEDFGATDAVFYIFADGTEGELRIASASGFRQLPRGPYQVLLEKQGMLASAPFSADERQSDAQLEILRRQVNWFWHDLSHFITALARGQLWWAYGQLEVLRHCVVNLARLNQDWLDSDVGEEPFFKIERALSPEALRPLEATVVPKEAGALLPAVHRVVDYYRALAPRLTEAHGLSYPAALERVLMARLNRLGGSATPPSVSADKT